MDAINENQQKFDSLDKAKDKLTENLTGILEKYDEKLDLHEMAIELSEVTDRGNDLYKEMDAFLNTLVGPGFEDDKVVAPQLEALMDGLQKLLDEDLPDVLKQRLAEERDNELFGKISKGAKQGEMEPELVHKADMFMYSIDLKLLKDPAINGSLLAPVFNEALGYAVSDLDADGEVRTWGALSLDTANLAVDKKWIASHPKVADRIVSLYLAALDHPEMESEDQDVPRLQEFETPLKTYDLLNVIGSPLKEQYQKQLDEIKKRG
jgi:hypothetical protein